MDEVDPIEKRERQARDLRRDILTRLDHFRDLQAARSHDVTAQRATADNAAQLEQARGALLRDIRELSGLMLQLEKTMDDKRWTKWFLPPCLGMFGYFLYLQLYKLPYLRKWTPAREINERGEHRPAFLTILALLPWFTRPLALYKIYLFEKRRSQTGRLQESLDDLETQVARDSPLLNTNCLEASKWDDIPWDECKDIYDKALLYISTGL